jgi:hypothetical protein
MEKNNVIAEAGELIYNIIFSAPSLSNVYDELLLTVADKIFFSEKRRLLVMGTGPSGSPYHLVPFKMKKFFKNSKVVFLDYSPNVIASCFARYNELGIIGDNGLESQVIASDDDFENISKMIKDRGFNADIKPKSELKESDLEGKITFLQHDLRDPIPKELGKFDAVDSTFTLHHVAQYRHVLIDRLNEINCNLLDKRGLFHWGTGLCDMGYSEKKIQKIAENASKAAKTFVTLIDNRQSEYPYEIKSIMEPYSFDVKKAANSGDKENQITIDENGIVYVPAKLVKEDIFMGYARNGDFFEFPLIDPEKEEDQEALIRHVQEFYIPTNIEISKIKSYDPEMVKKAVEADRDERINAEKGLREYYLSEEDAFRFLEKAGFEDIRVARPNKDKNAFEGLVNILSYK